MGVFVINEWLWADICGQNEGLGPRQMEAALFVGALMDSDHKFVMVLDSKFEHKAFAACTNENPPQVRLLAMKFLSLRLDSDHCILYRTGELAALPHNLTKVVKNDDHYLVRALLTREDSTLVTSDKPLRDALAELVGRCISREEFLKTYFKIPS